MRLKVRKVRPNYHYSNPTFIRGAYKKALLVIDSCETEDHFNAAQNYLSNFLMMLSDKVEDRIYETDTFNLKMFNRLKKKFLEKKSSLGW